MATLVSTLEPLVSPMRVLDPRLVVSNQRLFAIIEGGADITIKQYNTTTASNQNYNFSCNPPDVGTIVDRKIYLQASVDIAFSGSTTGGLYLLNDGYDAWRAYPLSQNMQNLQITLNTAQVSIPLSDVIGYLLRFNNDPRMQSLDYSGTPSMMDASQEYAALATGNRNPLGNYQDSINGTQYPRAGFPMQVLSNTAGGSATAEVKSVFTEPLFISPLAFGGEQDVSGFIGVSQMSVYISWLNTRNRWWSHAVNSQVTSFNISSVNLDQNPVLKFIYIRPNAITPLPAKVTYPLYNVIANYTDLTNSYAYLASDTKTTSTFTLGSIPRRIYLLMRPQNSALYSSPLFSDTFFQINSVQVQWGTKTGLLSSSTTFDLYNIARRNGLCMSYPEFSGVMQTSYNPTTSPQSFGSIGSICCFEMGIDIPLEIGQCPGLAGQFQLQFTVSFTNLSASAVTPTIETIFVNDGTFTITPGNAEQSLAPVTPQIILNARELPAHSYAAVRALSGSSGGDFFGTIKDWINKVLPYVKGAINVGKTVYDVAKPIASLVGLGEGLQHRRKHVAHKRMRGRGGVVIGGSSENYDSDEYDEACEHCNGAGCDYCHDDIMAGAILPASKLRARMRQYQ